MAYAISALGSAVEHDTGNGLRNFVLPIDSTHWLLAYQTSGGDGFAQVFTVDGSGNVSEVGTGVEFDTADLNHCAACLMDGSGHVLVVWSGTGFDGFARILTVNLSTWDVTAEGTAHEFDTTQGVDLGVQKIDSTHALVTFRGVDGDGFALALTINTSTWAVTTTAGTSLEFDTTNANNTSLLKLNNDDTRYLVVYTGESSDGYAKVLTLASYVPSVTSTLEFDTANGMFPRAIPLDTTHALVLWAGGATAVDLRAQVLSVNTSTWAITAEGSPLSVYTYTTALTEGYPFHMLILYEDGTNYYVAAAYTDNELDGKLQILSVNKSTWAVTLNGSALEFDTSSGLDPALAKVSDSRFITWWGGVSNDGFVRAFDAAPEGLYAFTVEEVGGGPIRTRGVGEPFDVVITAKDFFGATVTDFTDTVDVSATGATLSSGSGTSGAFTAGVLTLEVEFSDIGAAITIDVEDTDTGLALGSSDEFAVWDLEATVDGANVDLAWSDHTPADGAEIHRSQTPGFTPASDPPASFDGEIIDFGWDLDGSATDPGKDEGITFFHLGNMLSGYARVEGPGEAFAYNDEAAGLWGDTLKLALGGPGGDSDETLDDVFQALYAPLEFEDACGLTVRQFRGLSASVRDFARLALLIMRRGLWNTTRVIPSTAFAPLDEWATPGTLIGHVGVPIDTPITAGADANGDYLGITTLGGGTSQTAIGPGIYGWGVWLNYEVGESGNPPWPMLPADTMIFDGHFGEEMCFLIPSWGLIVTSVGGFWGDTQDITAPSNWLNNLQLLADIVTGAGSLTPTTPGANWATETYANAGIDETACDDLATAIGGDLFIARHGYQIHTAGDETAPIDWASAGAKSSLALLTAHAVGLHTLIDTVADAVDAYEDTTATADVEHFYRVVFTDTGAPLFESNEASATPTGGGGVEADVTAAHVLCRAAVLAVTLGALAAPIQAAAVEARAGILAAVPAPTTAATVPGVVQCSAGVLSVGLGAQNVSIVAGAVEARAGVLVGVHAATEAAVVAGVAETRGAILDVSQGSLAAAIVAATVEARAGILAATPAPTAAALVAARVEVRGSPLAVTLGSTEAALTAGRVEVRGGVLAASAGAVEADLIAGRVLVRGGVLAVGLGATSAALVSGKVLARGGVLAAEAGTVAAALVPGRVLVRGGALAVATGALNASIVAGKVTVRSGVLEATPAATQAALVAGRVVARGGVLAVTTGALNAPLVAGRVVVRGAVLPTAVAVEADLVPGRVEVRAGVLAAQTGGILLAGRVPDPLVLAGRPGALVGPARGPLVLPSRPTGVAEP